MNHDIKELTRLLDKIRVDIFTSKNHSAFFGSIMCSLETVWSETEVEYAGVNSTTLYWNPDFFTHLYKNHKKYFTKNRKFFTKKFGKLNFIF